MKHHIFDSVYYQSSGIIFASRNTLPAKRVLLLKLDEKKLIAKPGAYSFATNFSLTQSSNTKKDTHKLGNADGSRNTGKDC